MAFADTPAASASSRRGATWTWPAAEVRNALQARTPLSTLARCWRAAQCFAAVAAPPPSWRAPRPAKSAVTAKSHRNYLGWWWRWWAEGPQLGIRFARDSRMTQLAEQVASKTWSLQPAVVRTPPSACSAAAVRAGGSPGCCSAQRAVAPGVATPCGRPHSE